MDALKSKRGFVCDRDGVIYHGARLLEGSKGFVEWRKAQDKRHLFLTNSSARSPRELHQRLSHMGIDTALVLSGITRESDLQRYAYKPHYILKDVSGITVKG